MALTQDELLQGDKITGMNKSGLNTGAGNPPDGFASRKTNNSQVDASAGIASLLGGDPATSQKALQAPGGVNPTASAPSATPPSPVSAHGYKSPGSDLPKPWESGAAQSLINSPAGQFALKEGPILNQAVKDNLGMGTGVNPATGEQGNFQKAMQQNANPLNNPVAGQAVSGAGDVLNTTGDVLKMAPQALGAAKDIITGNYAKDAQGNALPSTPEQKQQEIAQTEGAFGSLNKAIGGAGKIFSAPIAASPAMQKTLSLPFEAAHDAIGGLLKETLGIDPNSQHGQNMADGILNGIMLGAGAGSDIMDAVKKGDLSLADAWEQVKKPANALKDMASQGTIKIKDSLNNQSINSIKSDWAKPAKNLIKPGQVFDSAASQGHNIAQTLTDNKLNPAQHVVDGKFDTADLAQKMRDDAGKMSQDMLRPSLAKADLTVAKTPVAEIIDKQIADLKNSKNITAGDMQAQVAKAKSEGAALQEKYPNGMSLVDMHNEKITYSQNGGYKPLGTVEDNNTAAVNRSFGRTLDQQVQTKAPSDIPVKPFNQELQKQYQAADYLDALHGKKAPVSFTSKLAKTVSKGAGATAGAALGGGIFGSFAGYNLGGMVESMFEKIPSPLRESALANLKVTNPVAFTKMQDYMAQPASIIASPTAFARKGGSMTDLATNKSKTINLKSK